MAIKDNLLKYEGSVYLAPLNLTTDAFEGYYESPIECRVWEISREDGDTTELKSKQRDRYDQLIDSEETAGTASIAVEFLEVPKEIMAVLFSGSLTTFTQTSGTVTDEVVTIPVLGRWVPLANAHLNDGVAAVVTNTAGDTTYVVNTDYKVDYRQGLILAVSGGAITAGQSLKVDYTKLAKSGVTVAGETALKANFRLKFDGKNRYNGKDTYGEVWQVNLKSSDPVDLLSSEAITAKLAGPMITPTGKTSPYYLRVID